VIFVTVEGEGPGSGKEKGQARACPVVLAEMQFISAEVRFR
jgi:hypothetical protein